MAGQGLKSANIWFGERGVRDGSSPMETWEPDASTAQRKFLVNWTDRANAAWACIGFGTVVDGVLSRYLPEVHPEYPWLSAVRVSQVKGIKWLEKGTFTSFNPEAYIQLTNAPLNVFQYAELTVDYGFLEYEVVPDQYLIDNDKKEHFRYVIESTRQSEKYLSFPQGGMRWAAGTPSAGQTVIGSVGKVEVSTEYVYRWVQVPDEAFSVDRFDDFCGCINSVEFRGKPPGTMLLKSVQRKRTRMPYGKRAWEIEFAMKYFKHGHNNIYDFRAGQNGNPGPAGYYQISTDGTAQSPGSATDGKLIADERDFEDLFLPE